MAIELKKEYKTLYIQNHIIKLSVFLYFLLL